MKQQHQHKNYANNLIIKAILLHRVKKRFTSLLKNADIDQEERVHIDAVFKKYETSPGIVELWDLRKILKELNLQMHEDDLFIELREFGDIQNGRIDYAQYWSFVSQQKRRRRKNEYDNETRMCVLQIFFCLCFRASFNVVFFRCFFAVQAFVALGGNNDKSGQLELSQLVATFNELGLNVDVASLIKEMDDNKDGLVDFQEFSALVNDSPQSANGTVPKPSS